MMGVESCNPCANRLMATLGGGSATAGAQRVTAAMQQLDCRTLGCALRSRWSSAGIAIRTSSGRVSGLDSLRSQAEFEWDFMPPVPYASTWGCSK